MKLPKIKIRDGREFHLVNDFHSKLDAQKELQKLRNENALFGKRKTFVFSSENSKIVYKHGVYEQVFYAN
ncbi:hypothetical protein AB4865_05310 [Capnocytophaga sp. ARDL2]|uniref:Uncharacterized protein n=1 Tax=Capnocytophaga canis TaxID=1848903 RepID=A0A3A1YFP4_9FLAO|nr:hypothetical protein [Capnocytophaga canis]RIY36109.1 hypothetical protein CKY20_08195 [Capnocytophaga canis]CEN43799.1 hypothetical protein CCAND95_300014 [Capnocytophaga canis]